MVTKEATPKEDAQGELRVKLPMVRKDNNALVPASVYEAFARSNMGRKVDMDSLAKYSTICGTVSNKPFTRKVIDFLKTNSSSNFVILEVMPGMGETIVNIAVRWAGSNEAAEKLSGQFASLVNNRRGSLRPEFNIQEGWDTYESE